MRRGGIAPPDPVEAARDRRFSFPVARRLRGHRRRPRTPDRSDARRAMAEGFDHPILCCKIAHGRVT